MKKPVVSVLAVLLLAAMLGACGAPAVQTPPPATATLAPTAAPTPPPTPEPTPEPTPGPTPEPTPAPTDRGEKTGLYYPGEYTAKAKGYGGYVAVTVTVDDNSITDVQITGDQETVYVGGIAIDELPAEILEAQSSQVDGVAGATFTSTAIKTALDLALTEARGE